MTNVTMIKDNNDNYVGFELKGHAGYANIGHDIVCAAVSTLSQATMIGVSGVLGIDSQQEEGEAYLKFMIDPTNDTRMEKAQVLFKTMALALDDIQWQYKDFVKVCTTTVDMV